MQTDDPLRGRIHAILAGQAMVGPDDVSDEMRLTDLGIDSMGLVEAIFAIEEAFDIQVPYNANAPEAADFDLSTVGAVVAGVRRLVDRRTK